MALQELDLTIEYRLGSKNRKADALSKYPVSLLESGNSEESIPAVVAAIHTCSTEAVQSDEDSAGTLSERQRANFTLSCIIRYLENEVSYWCKACLVCTTRNVGQAIKLTLTPIPVGGPFNRVGVDVLQLPKSSHGNCYDVLFMDYLTKWSEVFATADQSTPTIAKLLVEKVISRHGVPKELLSDRGASFLSKLIAEICKVTGIKKVNTTAYLRRVTD